MAREKIFAVGFDFPGGEVAEFDLSSDQSLLEADIIVFEPGFGELQSISYDEYGEFDEDDLLIIEERIKHWCREIKDACDAGSTVFIFLVKPQEASVDRESVSSYSAIPISLPDVLTTSGSEIRADGDLRYLVDYWNRFSKHSHYELYFAGDFDNVDVILKTRSGDRTVGAAIRSGRGTLILVPPIRYDSDAFIEQGDENEEQWSGEAVQFGHSLIGSLVAVHRAINGNASITPAPDWASDTTYRLRREDELEEAIRAKSSEIEILQAELHKLEGELDVLGALRRLLYEQGEQLEEAILDALMLFGFEAKPYQDADSEFDAVFTSAEGRFLGEAEGKENRPIHINKLRQLTQNVQEDFARDEIAEYAKGVLFGNPHRSRLPDERPNDFTTKCVSSAEHSRVALVRTADMFDPARYLSENDDPEYARLCREVIHQCEGKVVEFPEPPSG